MAQFDMDPQTPLGVRLDRFADALEREGQRRRAAVVRQLTVEYRRQLAEGDIVGAVATFASLDYSPTAPSGPH